MFVVLSNRVNAQALRYLVGGLELNGSDSGLSAGTIAALTTLQTRLLLSVNQLLRFLWTCSPQSTCSCVWTS